MWKKLLTMTSAALLLAVASCGGETPALTSTPAAPATPAPTATPEATEAPQLTEAERAYMRWLADMHGTFEQTSQGLVERWQSSEKEGAGEVSPGTVEEMESLASTLQDYVEEVEGRQDVPVAVAEIHAALLNEVHHWEAAAPLLVEGVGALSDGDEALFQETAEQADEEIQAAVEARRELLEAANRLLQAIQEGQSS